MKRLLSIVGVIAVLGIAQTASALSLSWDPYTEDPTFKEFRFYRAMGTLCGIPTYSLPPLMEGTKQFTVTKGLPTTPQTVTDTTLPSTQQGLVCYEMTAVNTNGTGILESRRSNRAFKLIQPGDMLSPQTLSIVP